jgi:osmoprotectant transport system permease protein
MRYLLSKYNYDLTDPGSIPNLIVQHLNIVAIAMLISLAIGIPLGVLVVRYRWLYLPIISFTGFLYTIPSIALVAILISIPALGLSLATIMIPLVLYNQLVLIRNTAAGINAVDPLLLEVGRAVGMSSRQVLFRVTFPLALPVIIAGIRLATVTTIGIAALASLVGEGGLGDLIFKNISVDIDAVTAGAILLALMAILADLLLLFIQRLLNRGRNGVSLA